MANHNQRADCAREFGEIGASLSELKKEVYTDIKEQFAEHKEQFAEHEKAIHGNGQPGLKTRVDRLEQAQLSRRQGWAIILGLAANLLTAVITKILN